MNVGTCVREKHIKTIRRPRSVKPISSSDVDHNHMNDRNSSLAKSMLESGLKPWTYNMGFNASVQNGSNINNGSNNSTNPNNPTNCGAAQNPGFDDCGWGYCTEEQLEEILLKHMEFLYNEAISKLIGSGCDEEVALRAILGGGDIVGKMDVLTNILQNSLDFLRDGYCAIDEYQKSHPPFTDLRELEEYSLERLVRQVKKARPHLSRGDAMWCLLMSDLDVARASTIDIPVLPSPSNESCNSMVNVESVNSHVDNAACPEICVPPGLCKFHGGWGFGNVGNAEVPGNGMDGVFAHSGTSVKKESDCAKKFNLSPSMKSMLKKNVAAFNAGFHSKEQQQQKVSFQPCASSPSNADLPKNEVSNADVQNEVSEESRDIAREIAETKDIINSVLNKFRDLNLDENLECVSEDQKDEIILTLLHQVKDLEQQVSERKEWAHQKAMQAARKLSSDLTELKILRMERDETQRLKKGKQTLEDSTMKKLSEMENALRKASGQVDRANEAVKQLEVENAEIRAEMEASKLSASESVKTCLEVAKREKKCLKRLLAWEKQKTKLQEEIAAERRKITGLQQQLVQINATQKEAEAKWKEEVKEKEHAMALVEEERRSKENTEGYNKRKLEALRLRIEIDFQRHKDDLQRLEQELSRLKASSHLTEPNDSSETFARGSPEAAKNQGQSIARLLRELDEPERECSGRECMVCRRDEVSVVFLPCAHQVMCASCGENYGKKGKPICPYCRVPIEQKIRVFGASS